MQMLYNSDQFVVVAFERPAVEGGPVQEFGGYEIVDKLARKEIYFEGALARQFRQGVQALVDQGPDAKALDAFIGGYTGFAQQPLVVH